MWEQACCTPGKANWPEQTEWESEDEIIAGEDSVVQGQIKEVT